RRGSAAPRRPRTPDRVGSRHGAPGESLLEDELQVLDGAPLAVAVTQHRERGVARAPEQRERAGGEARRLAHRLDAVLLDAGDVPPCWGALRHRDVAGPARDPALPGPGG